MRIKMELFSYHFQWVILTVLFPKWITLISAVLPPEPELAEPLPNITITAGRNAILPCVIDNLGVYRVVWIKVDTQTVLTFHTTVITQNSRIQIVYNGHRNWDLHIRHIQESDRGLYMCQINSSPMKNQVGYIEVVVPPDIVFDESSSDVIVVEGGTATMFCKTTGYPKPKVQWKREDGEPIHLKTTQKEKTKIMTLEGDSVTLTKVSRRNMGNYLCIASNGIPPVVSKRVMLHVTFEPLMKVQSQLVGAPVGTEIVLECYVEAWPKCVNYWTRDSGEILLPNEHKYNILRKEVLYKLYMKLRIKVIEKKDFGGYSCIAKNSMGEAEGQIKLYELELPEGVKSTSQLEDKSFSIRIEGQYSNDSSSPGYKALNSRNNLIANGVDEANKYGKTGERDTSEQKANGGNIQNQKQLSDSSTRINQNYTPVLLITVTVLSLIISAAHRTSFAIKRSEFVNA